MHMLLINNGEKIEISHFHYLISAYELTKENSEDLKKDILEAMKIAKETKQTQIVSHDRVDFCLHIHPSGGISVMAQIRFYEKVEIS